MTERGRTAATARVREEMDFLEVSRDDLRRRLAGRYLVIRGRAVIGDFGSEEEAFREGVRLCGTKPFLLAKVGGPQERAWVSVLTEVDAEGSGSSAVWVPPPSWRRGALVENSIVWTSTPAPPGDSRRGTVRDLD